MARNEIFTSLVKDISMHIAASSPEFISEEAVPLAAREAAKAEFTDKAQAEGKPTAMIEKIVEGMLKKHFAERCLLNQPFIKNPDITVGEYLKEHIAKLGENIVVRRFNRMALGEVTE